MGSFVVYVSAGFGEIVADFRKREGRVFEGRFECGYNFVVDSRGGFNESVVFFFGVAHKVCERHSFFGFFAEFEA